MLDALSREMSGDRDARFWLVESWEKQPEPIDAEWFAGMAKAAGGELARSPRFRSWLRGEWTAWARQQFRRIAREAEKVRR